MNIPADKAYFYNEVDAMHLHGADSRNVTILGNLIE